MSDKRLVWLREDDEENINLNGIDFKKAKEVVLNETSVQIHNIHGDYAFIGG